MVNKLFFNNFIFIFLIAAILFLLLFFALMLKTEIFNKQNKTLNPEIKNFSLESIKTSFIANLVRPFAVIIDSNGLIYISDFGGHKILIYDQNYSLVKEISPGLEILRSPHGLDFDSEGNWYVADFLNKKIQKFSKEGKFLGTFISAPFLEGPATAYFDNEGNILVSDYSSNSLLKFSKEGKFLGWIGAKLNGKNTEGWDTDWQNRVGSNNPGGFDRLHSARVSKEGMLYVVDTWNNRIQKFSKEGKFLGWIAEKSEGTLTEGWEKSGKAEATKNLGGFDKPIALDFDENGDLIIFEFGNGRIQKFSKEGKFLELLALGFNQGYDLRIKENKLYVVDTGNKNIKIINLLRA